MSKSKRIINRRLKESEALFLGITPRVRKKGQFGNSQYKITKEQASKIKELRKTYTKEEVNIKNERLSLEEAEFLNHNPRLEYRAKKSGNPQYYLKRSEVDKLKKYREENKKPRRINPKQSEVYIAAENKKHDKRRKTFIITWAQNATKVHDGLFDNILVKAKEQKAAIHVLAGRYSNSSWVDKKGNEHFWDKRVLPYLFANRHKIHENLEILGEVNIRATAVNPLRGLESFTGLESCIVGHPRVHMKFLPVLPDYPKKQILTTGACTVPNYTESGSGAKGEFHHSLGFVIVECEGKDLHIRNVKADRDGNFYDLGKHYKDGEIIDSKNKSCDVITLGDLHLRQINKVALKKSFDLIKEHNPKYVVVHDLMDGKTVSPYASSFMKLYNEENNESSVEEEIQEVLDWVGENAIDKPYKMVVVASNHNDWIDRWLDKLDWHKSGGKYTYLKYAKMKADLILKYGKKYKGILAHLIDERFGDAVITLDRNASLRINDIEHGLHSDKGVHGSRGSANQFRKLNTKNTIGHGHGACILDGCVMAGSLTDEDMWYDKGLSARSASNVIQYEDGKRQVVTLVKGKFCR